MTRGRRFLELHSPTRRESLIAAGILLLSVLAFRLQALPELASSWIGGAQGDSGLYVWLFRNAAQSLFSDAWFNAGIFFPYTRALAWSDSFILPSIVGWPFIKVGIPEALIYNLIILLAGFLNGYATWRLAFRLVGSPLSAISAALAFMLFSGFSANLGHPQLQFAFWIPLALTALLHFIENPSPRYSLSCGVCITLAFLSSVYFAVYALLAVFACLAGLALLRPERMTLRDYAVLLAGMLAGLIPLVPFLLPYFDVRQTFGARGIYEFYYFAASLGSYFSSSQFNLLYRFTADWGHEEAHLFGGITLLILSALAFTRLGGTKKLLPSFYLLFATFSAAIILSLPLFQSPLRGYLCAVFLWAALGAMAFLLFRIGSLEKKLGVLTMTNRALIALVFFCALIFFVLSFGPLGAPDGNPQKGQFAPGVLTFLYYLFPGMNSLRAVSRAGIVCVFFLSLTLPFAMEYLNKKRRVRTLVIAGLIGLIAIENYNFAFPIEKLPPAPQVLKELSGRVAPSEVTLFLPLTSRLDANKRIQSWADFARLNTFYMNWAAAPGIRIMNGYSGQRPKLLEELPRELSAFPDQRSLNALSSIAGLRYIVFCSSFESTFNRQEFFARMDKAPWLKLLAADEQGNYLFEFQPQVLLKPDFLLDVPSFPPGMVRLELMTMASADGKDIPLDIFMKDSLREVPVAAVSVRAAGTWDFYGFRLPQSSDFVRPVKLVFRLPEGKQVYLRQSRVGE